MKLDIKKNDEGKIVVKGLSVDTALVLRRSLETNFDATVHLAIGTDDTTAIVVAAGHNDGALGEDETPEMYRAWIGGWSAGRQEGSE